MKNNAIFAEQEKRHTKATNEVMRQKDVEQTIEDVNEWVNELHVEINDVKIVVKESGREEKAAN